MLTDKQVRALKPKDKVYTILDGEGLFLIVRPNGRKVWFSRFKFNKKRISKAIGEYPSLKLSDARAKHREMLQVKRTGENPFKSGEYTVNDLAKDYIAGIKKKSAFQDRRNLDNDVLPHIGEKPVADVSPRDVVLCCQEIVDRGATKQARAVYSTIRTMFKWAIGEGLIQSSPCSELNAPGEVGGKKERHLSVDEIHTLFKCVDERLDRSMAGILKLILLTGQRPGEVAGMRYEEIDGRIWTVPAHRRKTGVDNRVYLTDMTLEIIGEGKGLCFPSPITGKQYKVDKPAKAVQKLLKWRIRGQRVLDIPSFSPHDLRRTHATLLGESGYSDDQIALILGHARKGVTAVYNRSTKDKEKREMAECIIDLLGLA